MLSKVPQTGYAFRVTEVAGEEEAEGGAGFQKLTVKSGKSNVKPLSRKNDHEQILRPGKLGRSGAAPLHGFAAANRVRFG